MPSVSFKFEGKDLEIDGEKYTVNYTRNGVVKLQINGFTAADVGTYECYGTNDFGNMMQPVLVMMAQYPEFIKAPLDVNLIGVNGGKVECEIYGVPKPNVTWFKDFAPLKETSRVQNHHYPPQTYTLFFEDYITKDEGLYSVTASNICGSISYSVMVRILEDEQEFDWMTYRRTKQSRAPAVVLRGAAELRHRQPASPSHRARGRRCAYHRGDVQVPFGPRCPALGLRGTAEPLLGQGVRNAHGRSRRDRRHESCHGDAPG